MDYKQAGQQIRALRKERQLTQKELADAVGRSESSIAKYEQGLTEIPNSVLATIAQVLSVNIATLLGLDRKTPTPFSVAFSWLHSLGYKIVVYEEEDYRRVILRDVTTHTDHIISDNLLHDLVDNLESYTRFKIQELLNTLGREGS